MKRKLTLLGDKGYPLYVMHFSPLCPENAYLDLRKAAEWKTCFEFDKDIDYLTLIGDGYRKFKLNWQWINRLEKYR